MNKINYWGEAAALIGFVGLIAEMIWFTAVLGVL